MTGSPSEAPATQGVDLERASRPRPRADKGVYDVEIPDGWQQGRGAFGGLTIAALTRSIELFETNADRPLRTLSVELPGAVRVGPAEVLVEVVRIGSGQSTIAARLLQAGEVRATGVAVLARPRAPDAATYCELTAPDLPDWRSIAPIPSGVLSPVFARQFEYRTVGPLPFEGGPCARAQGWVRLRDATAETLGDAAYLAALLDAWWPAAFARMTTPRPVGTVAFNLQVVGSPRGIDPAVPFAYRAHTWSQVDGWLVEQRELWTADGRLLALNQQTIAIIA